RNICWICAPFAIGAVLVSGTLTGRAAKNGLTLDQVLSNMHAASLKLHTVGARITQQRYNTDLGGKPDLYQGEIYMDHKPSCDKIRMWYSANNEVYQDVLVECEKIKLYQPRTKQVIVTTRSKQASKDPQYDFLATPYSSVSSLKTRYKIEYAGDEPVNGSPAARLNLTPFKASPVKRIVLWIDQKTWIPVQYQFIEDSTTTTFTLNDVKMNQGLRGDIFTQKTAPGTKEVKQ
ncbi:MAG: LolA family protein, partial [Blastocatellia bacterium]